MRELHAGRHLRLVERNGWEFVERPGVRGIVVVAAVTPGGRLLLVEQRREPVGTRVVELPAGLAGDGGGLEVISFDGDTLQISYHGACGACPSSTGGTLRYIEGMLQEEVDPNLRVISY